MYIHIQVVGQLSVDVPKLERMYPITDRPLLIKCGVVLSCVSFLVCMLHGEHVLSLTGRCSSSGAKCGVILSYVPLYVVIRSKVWAEPVLNETNQRIL